ncbi:MAG: hypothetical protein ACR2FI_07370 [Burkholderiales bacterium]|nr:hypothetical protein [Burkholderiales bacterium]
MNSEQRSRALFAAAIAVGAAAGYLLYQAWRRHQQHDMPQEIAPLPLDRAYDRQKNIDYLAENYPVRRYEPPRQPMPQPDPAQDFISKEKDPLHGFHGG